MTDRTSSGRELARRLGVSHTAIQRAERAGRIAREPDGAWDVEATRRQLVATATPGRSLLAPSAETTTLGRLTLARPALGVEAQRLAMDEKKGRQMDLAVANHRINEVTAGMRDAVLN